jgi:hypothetical protein
MGEDSQRIPTECYLETNGSGSGEAPDVSSGQEKDFSVSKSTVG